MILASGVEPCEHAEVFVVQHVAVDDDRAAVTVRLAAHRCILDANSDVVARLYPPL